MADVAEEGRFGLVQFGQRGRPLLGFDPGLGGADGGGDLSRDQFEESQVGFLRREHAAQSDDEDGGRPLAARVRHR